MEKFGKLYRGETSKAHDRRVREGWHQKYAPPNKVGLDIGSGIDFLNYTFRRWDIIFGDSDAHLLKGLPDNIFHTVYAAHILEHMQFPIIALTNWWRVLKADGHLIVCVPHRDLYEKHKRLPSRWNIDHKHYWLPEESCEPCTLSLRDTLIEAIPAGKIVDLRVVDDGYNYNLPQHEHPIGEYSIEAVVKKC